ncbi:MAG: galactose mutarotase [Propionicimonas sp.]|uniref:aldose epimerase family protein n=1 Tax=Propionicimonas sp. TaxID=1955623 RepID=UPI001DAD1170|nr:aldose epimerase family protein [Propionicimonas sp.]MBU4188199.1 galactose mutarotase [Actinomycetota bacterium]MBU4408747.1 galactose mutarotase [Actinomycetota bacterium]MBU4417753.1 galactose mutarotase [Actinomycetota bacterium]MCG2806400.1 galactose mutarotase [Propionicimonas sp.]
MTELLHLSAEGVRLELLSLGATMRRFDVATAEGWRNIILGHSQLADYQANLGFLGASVGRFANRIDQARITVEGQVYELDANEPPNQVHGGGGGFSRCEWRVLESEQTWAELSLTSPDGDQGFPGQVRATARFEVFSHGAQVTYTATTDAPTVVNLTTHPYFNLDGEGSGNIDHHRLQIAGSHFTPTRPDGIPTGEVRTVSGTALDFRDGEFLGAARLRAEAEQLTRNGGFDHNFAIDGADVRRHCRLVGATGLGLEISSDQPGLQVYTGDHFAGELGTSGQRYPARAGVALETQGFPDAPNHPGFPNTVLRPGQEYRTTTRWQLC